MSTSYINAKDAIVLDPYDRRDPPPTALEARDSLPEHARRNALQDEQLRRDLRRLQHRAYIERTLHYVRTRSGDR